MLASKDISRNFVSAWEAKTVQTELLLYSSDKRVVEHDSIGARYLGCWF